MIKILGAGNINISTSIFTQEGTGKSRDKTKDGEMIFSSSFLFGRTKYGKNVKEKLADAEIKKYYKKQKIQKFKETLRIIIKKLICLQKQSERKNSRS